MTETYLSLRRLENRVLEELAHGQVTMYSASESPIQVSISQFYGIEINDFAVTVAKTALWIAESQMMKETEKILLVPLEFLPLKTNACIAEGNALRMDWEDVVPKTRLNYIMGNPPFVGARLMDKAQKEDIGAVFSGWKNAGNLDYVCCWYKKASDLMRQTSIRSALVSTNSVSQGESVANLWKPLFEAGVHIDFAYRTFQWDSEAKIKAHVHCVIIGFSISPSQSPKRLYTGERYKEVQNICAYLVDAPNIFVDSRKKPLCNVPSVVFGSMPNDGGFLSSYTQEDYDKIVDKYPESAPLFKRFVGASEFLRNKVRWCLWLENVSPSLIKKIPPIMDAVQNVKMIREQSDREATRKLAESPSLFGEIRQPKTAYIIIPRHSSQNRKYIPMGFVSSDIICGDANLLLPDATLYHFGVLMSNVHNAWIKTVCGRIKSDYRYSVNVVYNNFPWPEPTNSQRERIEKTAQMILNARTEYSDWSLSDLYDDNFMPKKLRQAHRENDRAVMDAYGFVRRTEARTSESACVAELMKLYQKKVAELDAEKKK